MLRYIFTFNHHWTDSQQGSTLLKVLPCVQPFNVQIHYKPNDNIQPEIHIIIALDTIKPWLVYSNTCCLLGFICERSYNNKLCLLNRTIWVVPSKYFINCLVRLKLREREGKEGRESREGKREMEGKERQREERWRRKRGRKWKGSRKVNLASTNIECTIEIPCVDAPL